MALFIAEDTDSTFVVRPGENTLQAAASAPLAEGWADAAALSAATRKTGWTADTGTAKRTANTTYTAPTISATYTQAEVQALANALQDASRTIKALKDDLISHGLIGA